MAIVIVYKTTQLVAIIFRLKVQFRVLGIRRRLGDENNVLFTLLFAMPALQDTGGVNELERAGRQAFNSIYFRHRHLVKQAPRVRRHGFEVAPLGFGV